MKPTKDYQIRLWTHEILRVFFDRLVDEKDCIMLFNMIKGTVKDHFSKSMDSLFTNIKREGLPIDHEDMKSLIFGDYMDPDAEGDDRLYKEISGQFSNCCLLIGCIHLANQKRPY